MQVTANEQRFELENPAGQRLLLDVRVQRRPGLRYTAPRRGRREAPLRRRDDLPVRTRGPRLVAADVRRRHGLEGHQPSYEEHYEKDIPVGTPSPSPAGWVFPALFRTGPTWVALTEAGMDGSFHASRLVTDSSGGNYCLGLPMAREVFTGTTCWPRPTRHHGHAVARDRAAEAPRHPR